MTLISAYIELFILGESPGGNVRIPIFFLSQNQINATRPYLRTSRQMAVVCEVENRWSRASASEDGSGSPQLDWVRLSWRDTQCSRYSYLKLRGTPLNE